MYHGELCSYPIPAVNGLLRHYYWKIKKLHTIKEFEVHSGMEENLVPSNSYGIGRLEEERILCEFCKNKIIFDTYKKNKLFNIFFWNCDMITGHGHQTILMWLISLFSLASLISIDNLYVVAILLIILLLFNSPGLLSIHRKIPLSYCPHTSSLDHESYGMGKSL